MGRVFGVAAIGSALLWAAVVASWVAGHNAVDMWQTGLVGPPDGAARTVTQWMILSYRGALAFEHVSVYAFVTDRTQAGGRYWGHERDVDGSNGRWFDSRFHIRTYDGELGVRQLRREVLLPHWAAALATAATPATWLVRLRSYRRPPGRCRRCGYDLRASPERCPECGAVVTAPER